MSPGAPSPWPASLRPGSALAAPARTDGESDFTALFAQSAQSPLAEILPAAAPGDDVAALGFALAWTLAASAGGPIVWALPETFFCEDGLPYAPGLAQFGVPIDRLLLVRTRTQEDALWTAEQALALPGAVALAAVLPAKRALSLTATRRLLLFAERSGARCALLRLDAAGASAAWTRWRVAAAASEAEERELGAPAFAVRLERNRAGPATLSWIVHWSAHDRRFVPGLSLSVAAAPSHRPAETARRRAG